MIRYLTESRFSDFVTFCSFDAFGCKIASLAVAYGLQTSFAGFWLQTNHRGIVTAALSKLDNAAVLSATKQADFEEIEAFLSVCGATSLLFNPALVDLQKGTEANRGSVMRLEASSYTTHLEKSAVDQTPSLEEIHHILCAAQTAGFSPPPFESFYVDFSHRIRHRCARCVGVRNQNGILCACACCIAELDHSAVLGAVATKPEYRRQQFGSKAVQVISQQLLQEGKQVFLFVDKQENKEFYQQLGFADITYWKEVSL